jgi:hypothetical protein
MMETEIRKPTGKELTNYGLGLAASSIVVWVVSLFGLEVPAIPAMGFTTILTWIAWRLGLGQSD